MADSISQGAPKSANPLATSARAVTRTLQATDFVQTHFLGGSGVDAAEGIDRPYTVKVKNGSGGDLARGKVLQLGSMLLTQLQRNYLWFNADTPADPRAGARCCILLNPLKEDAIGDAYVSGCCIASINVSDDTHTHASPALSSNDLASGFSGPIEILTPLSGTGVQEAAVRFGENPSYDRIEGLTTGAVAGGSTFTINNIKVRQGADPRTNTSSTSETVTVYNRFSEHANSGAICFAEWNASEQRWENYFLQSICPPGA